MFLDETIKEYPSILSILKSQNTPSYIAIPEGYNINQANVYGVITSVEESADEDGEIITECSVIGEQNAYLSFALRDFLFAFSDKADALNALVDIAIYHMDYLATQFFEAYNLGDYPRALCYAKAFEQQYYSIVDSVGLIFADDELANYIVNTIPFVEYQCEQAYNNPTE